MSNQKIEALVKELNQKCTTKCGSMPVYIDDLESTDSLFDNVIDEIMKINMAIEHGDLQHSFGPDLSVRAARGLVTRLRNYLKRNSPKHYEIAKGY